MSNCYNIRLNSRSSPTQKFNGANSKKEKQVDNSHEISTDLLNENDKHQSLSYEYSSTDIWTPPTHVSDWLI